MSLKEYPTCKKTECQDYLKRFQCYSNKRITDARCIYYKIKEDILDVMAHGIRNEKQLNLARRCGL